ncbi:siderophore-interacting protein [Sphingobium sp. CAP-1]|uniref:siderophore-interacting protein n=1 Tax=Sphingobium sp. CAP-1 TaxID=2676077 RepID=UPI0012BB3E12|nr:siderophore-interacting protein [Sphingobium sp. CAP-1]QGP81165.1 siderophore-interacting protein [Sphingobium sp. CAP-1]
MSDNGPLRMRHEGARRRTLTVAEKRQLTPHYLSIHFKCDDFGGFVSTSPDDHIKLFLPQDGPSAGRPIMRDYTPRGFDPADGTMILDFALHHPAGPATAWAITAKIGDRIEIGGPRGSVLLPDDCDWYWLIGDETALPAIARRIEEWPGKPIRALIAVTDADEQLQLAGDDIHWLHRPSALAHDPVALVEAVAALALPAGRGFIWIAAEAGVARALRDVVLDKGQPLARIKASGYWTQGVADGHARLD